MLFTIIAGLLGLGIVIFVHETGHFIAAKAAGIEVEAFSLGWGRPILRYTFKGTEYRLSALPLGGYCKLKGEQQLQQAMELNQRSAIDEEGSLFSVPAWKRILTYAAGPISNLLFSIVILALLWWIGFTVQTYENRIVLTSDYEFLSPSGEINPADQAGLLSGDRIVALAGIPVDHYRDIQEIVATRAGKELSLEYIRNAEHRRTTVTPRLNRDTGGGVIGVSPWIEPVIDQIESSSPAAAAGLRPGDRIIALEDTPIRNHLDLIQFLQGHPLRFSLTIERNSAEQTLRLIPAYDEFGNPVLGISFRNIEVLNRISNPLRALGRGISDSIETVSVSLKSIGMLFQGINLQKAVSGPIRITYMVGQVASYGFSQGIRTGLTSLFRFLSFLSVALFVMNLLPIPALDGGLIILSLFELIRGRQVTPKVFYRYQLFGFLFIMALLVLTTFSDIFFFFNN